MMEEVKAEKEIGHVHGEGCQCQKESPLIQGYSEEDKKSIYELLKKEFDKKEEVKGEPTETVPEQKKGKFEEGKIYILEGKRFFLKKRKDKEIILRLM